MRATERPSRYRGWGEGGDAVAAAGWHPVVIAMARGGRIANIDSVAGRRVAVDIPGKRDKYVERL